MNSDLALPPARARTRYGLAPLAWSTAPTASEAWPDKIRIEVRGHVEWPSGNSFSDYLNAIAPSVYFTARPTIGRRFRADIRYGPGITGELRLDMASHGRADEPAAGYARITLALNLNPTTVRANAIRRNTGPLEATSLSRFFKPPPSAQEAFAEGPFANRSEIPLDNSENVLLSPSELGGLTKRDRELARDEFLLLYETKLRMLVQEMLQPRPQIHPADGSVAGMYRVELDWRSLVLQQAEIYFERRTDDPVATVRRLHDRALDLARRIKSQFFTDIPSTGRPVPTTFAISQDDGYPHLVVPLTGTRNVELSIYAKTNRRIRFEIRYRRKFGNHLRACSTGDDRLTSLLTRLMENAARRLPWRSLGRAASVPPDVDIGDIPEFIRRLVNATNRAPRLFDPVVRQLVLTGGIFADEERFPGILPVIRRLERAGVLFRWQVQQKEERASRRYGLSDRFAAVRLKMLSGFIPTSLADLQEPEPEYPEDVYEENARLMGGRQWVSRPLQR